MLPRFVRATSRINRLPLTARQYGQTPPNARVVTARPVERTFATSLRCCVESSGEISTTEVTDDVITRLAAQPLHPLTLADLVRHGQPPLALEALLRTANFALSILPARLAHRIQSIRNLPYIVVSNPQVSHIHDLYVRSLSTILPFAERSITTAEEEDRFTGIMTELVQRHTNTIPTLAKGFMESRKYISPSLVTQFLDEHLRARIGTRLIAEQQLALHYASQSPQDGGVHDEASTYIGIIDTALRPAEVIRNCESFVAEICELRFGVRPTVVINGDPETRIAHVPVHLEYIVTELLKNAFRAVIEQGNEREPIEITIAPAPEAPQSKPAADPSTTGPNEKPIQETKQSLPTTKIRTSQQEDPAPKDSGSSILSLSDTTPGVTIRIRDRGGGISPENYANLFNYGFTTFNEHQILDAAGSGTDALNIISGASVGGSSLAGLGYGLPLGRAYAEYFGGGIAVQSLWGWGTDVYLSLRGVGKIDQGELSSGTSAGQTRISW